jgi:5-(carboxyamino)imidazole ribonucleotide synthase
MYNLIGDWPAPADILAITNAHLHLYGKTPRVNRKVGHVTINAPTHEECAARATKLERLLTNT